MKILFICKGNVGRSQIAEMFFNKLSKKHKSSSAGTHVDFHGIAGKKFKEIAQDIIGIMKEEGFDVSSNYPKQLIKEMADSADKIIMLAEKEHLPDYVDTKKVIFWKIQDLHLMSPEIQRNLRDKIKKLIEKLVKEIG
jgi:protein-tyrosine-phosphatase